MTLMENFNKIFRKNSCALETCCAASSSKYALTAGCTMELSSNTAAKKDEINKKLNKLVKKYIDKPEKLIQYIQLQGIKVYKIQNAEKLLQLFGEEEGFITPIGGIKGVLFNTVLSAASGKFKLCFKPEAVFVFKSKNTEIYTIARALHKYYGFKNGMPGFDMHSQSVFKKIYNRRKSKCADAQLDNTSFKDIILCREALKSDLDSINFALRLSLEHAQAKKALDKIAREKSAKI